MMMKNKKGQKMTFENLLIAIQNLIEKRAKTNIKDTNEHKRINEKLTKLYNIKYLMLEQQANTI